MPLKVHPDIASLVPYVPGKPIEELQRELGLPRAVKLASNENPIGPSPKALAVLAETASTLHRYPDGERSAYEGRWQNGGRSRQITLFWVTVRMKSSDFLRARFWRREMRRSWPNIRS